MKSLFFYQTEIGKIGIIADDETITNVYFEGEPVPHDVVINQTPTILDAAIQIQRYLTGQQKTFQISLRPEGTQFQRSVWAELCKIPYGETRTYGDIAKAIGNPKASRAVGLANHNNPIPIVIPCHREMCIRDSHDCLQWRFEIQARQHKLYAACQCAAAPRFAAGAHFQRQHQRLFMRWQAQNAQKL